MWGVITGTFVCWTAFFFLILWLPYGLSRRRMPNLRAVQLPYFAPFNGIGRAPERLTWAEAIRLYPHLWKPSEKLPKPPVTCSTCGADLEVCYHDIQKLDGDIEQPMVVTRSCPEGHGHYCDYA